MSDDEQEITFGEIKAWEPLRCPKCRSSILHVQGPCRRCGWSSLRDRELVFLDETFPCPQCGRIREPGEDHCPTCGSTGVLKEGGPASSFTIGALFLVTTVVAVCLAVSVPFPEFGIPLSILVGLAGLRTALLAARRKQHGYEVTNEKRLAFFGHAVGTLFLAMLCGIAVAFVSGGCLSSVLWSTRPTSTTTGLTIGICTLVSIPLIVLGLTRDEPNYTTALFAAIAVHLVALPSFWIPDSWIPGNRYQVIPILLLGGLTGAVLLGIWHLCRDSRKSTIAMLLGSAYVSYNLSGLLSIVFLAHPERAGMMMVTGLGCWLTLTTVAAVLASIWSFDDAFSS